MIDADRLDRALADAFAAVEAALEGGIPGAALGVVTLTGRARCASPAMPCACPSG
jgi:hypothetical protein